MASKCLNGAVDYPAKLVGDKKFASAQGKMAKLVRDAVCVNPCLKAVCHNNGTCVPALDKTGYTDSSCKCLVQFTGKQCSTDCSGGSVNLKTLACTPCKVGEEPSPDHSKCARCPAGNVGTAGKCTTCPPGSQPRNETHCARCPPLTATSVGICKKCPLGQRPNTNATGCLDIPPPPAGATLQTAAHAFSSSATLHGGVSPAAFERAALALVSSSCAKAGSVLRNASVNVSSYAQAVRVVLVLQVLEANLTRLGETANMAALRRRLVATLRLASDSELLSVVFANSSNITGITARRLATAPTALHAVWLHLNIRSAAGLAANALNDSAVLSNLSLQLAQVLVAGGGKVPMAYVRPAAAGGGNGGGAECRCCASDNATTCCAWNDTKLDRYGLIGPECSATSGKTNALKCKSQLYVVSKVASHLATPEGCAAGCAEELRKYPLRTSALAAPCSGYQWSNRSGSPRCELWQVTPGVSVAVHTPNGEPHSQCWATMGTVGPNGTSTGGWDVQLRLAAPALALSTLSYVLNIVTLGESAAAMSLVQAVLRSPAALRPLLAAAGSVYTWQAGQASSTAASSFNVSLGSVGSCPARTYIKDPYCYTCSLCPAGTFVTGNCSARANTTCAACAAEMYSVGNDNHACSNCTAPCYGSLFETVRCTPSTNRVCQGCPPGTTGERLCSWKDLTVSHVAQWDEHSTMWTDRAHDSLNGFSKLLKDGGMQQTTDALTYATGSAHRDALGVSSGSAAMQKHAGPHGSYECPYTCIPVDGHRCTGRSKNGQDYFMERGLGSACAPPKPSQVVRNPNPDYSGSPYKYTGGGKGHVAYAGHPAEAIPPNADGSAGRRRMEARARTEAGAPPCEDLHAGCALVLAAPAVDCDSDLGALSPEEHAAGTLLRSVCAASCGVCGAEAGAGAPEAPGAREQEEGA